MPLKKQPFLYVRLAEELRMKIESGEYAPGEFLPSEHELCERYGASRFSVRKALDLLVKEGRIVRRAGQGSKVAEPSPGDAPGQAVPRTITVFAASPSFYMDLGMPLIIERFEREHPGVTVRVIRLPNHSFWDFIQSLVSGDMQPDLLSVTQSQYAAIRRRDAFADLNRLVSGQASRIYTKLLKHFTDDFAVKAMPLSFSPVVLAYNPGLFRQYGVRKPWPGWTFDDVRLAMEMLTRDTNGDGIPDLYGMGFSSSVQRWLVFALQRIKPARLLFEQPEQLRKTLELMHELLYRSRTALLLPRGLDETSHPFLFGKTAMTLTTFFELANWKNRGGAFEPGVAPLALGPHRGTQLTMNGLMVPKEAANRDLAESFIRFSLRSDIQEAVARATGMLSVLKSVNDAVFGRTAADEMGIGDFHLEEAVFVEEEADDFRRIDKLEQAMGLFWLGLETADETIRRLTT